MNSFYGNNGALAAYHAHVLACGDILGLIGHGLPDVTVDLYAAEAVGLHGLHHPALTVHQGIGITHALVLALMQVALGKGSHPEEADERKDGKHQQLQIDTATQAAVMAAKTDPMEKQMMKKSPAVSSRIRQITATTAHICHKCCAKYSIIVVSFKLFTINYSLFVITIV